MYTALPVTMTMTDTDVLEAAVTKGGGQEAALLTTAIADLIVLESKCCTWIDLCCHVMEKRDHIDCLTLLDIKSPL